MEGEESRIFRNSVLSWLEPAVGLSPLSLITTGHFPFSISSSILSTASSGIFVSL